MQSANMEKHRALIAQYEDVYPGYQDRKPLIRRLLFTLVALRALYALLVIGVAIAHGIPLRPTLYAVQIVSVMVAWFFADAISRSGAKPLIYVMLLGGVYSLYQAYRDGIFFALGSDSWLFRLSNYVFIASILVQIGVPIFLLIDKKCRLFSTGMQAVQQAFTQWQKDQSNPAA